MTRKTKAQLDRDIAEVLAKPSRSEARFAKSQEKQTADLGRWSSWHKGVLNQIERWVEADKTNLGSWARHRSAVIKHLAKLESFMHVFYPGRPEDELVSVGDAAGMIILPAASALKLAQAYFSGGPGIAKDLHPEDLTWNMNWFMPRGTGRMFS